ncbi:M15 family metallopeptidase [Myxosarcina sp. GI1(2024)]
MDEIPEAIRVRDSISKRESSPLPLIVGGLFCLAVVGLLTIFLASSFAPRPQAKAKRSSEAVSKIKIEDDNTSLAEAVSKIKIEDDNTSSTSSPSTPTTPETSETPPVSPSKVAPDRGLLGHLPYEEAREVDLEAVTADGSIRLHPKAAAKFREMQAAAKAEGISLIPISGYRSVETQEHLFFEIKEERLQDATKRAEVSAPPGYSEHHTGYAIDIGDANFPEANVEPEFENTPAFRWLQENAAKFSFELSFPPNNSQGISYEPWHWRYVGDRHSLETFYKVRKSN